MVGGFLNRDFGVLTLLRASLKNAILKIVRNTAVVRNMAVAQNRAGGPKHGDG